MDLSSSKGHSFNHPYFQTAGMFIGEIFCLFYYFIYKRFVQETLPVQDPLSPFPPLATPLSKLGKLVFIIPSFLDFSSSALVYLGLALSAPSVYLMVRGFNLVIVALYSVLFLKLKLFHHQILGVVFACIGVSLVGLASVLNKASSAENPELGFTLIITAQFLVGGSDVAEHYFLETMTVHPLEAVGVEGISGFWYCLIALPILNLIPCNNDDICNGGYVENSVEAFRQVSDSADLAMLFVVFVFSLSLVNFAGAAIIQKIGALAKVMMETSGIILTWVFSMLVGWEVFLWLQLIGFIILVLGSAVYNEILVIPWWGFRKSIYEKTIYMEKRMEMKKKPKDYSNIDILSIQLTNSPLKTEREGGNMM